MSDTLIVALVISVIAAGPPTLAAWLTYRATQKVAQKADEIHVLTNSNLTAVKAELAAAKDMIARLTKELGG